MTDPLFWLGLSLLLVAVSLTAVLVAALPALQEIARAARSAEKLCDTLRQEFPPTLEAIRLTGQEIGELTDDLNTGVKSATSLVKQVDRGFDSARHQADRLQLGTNKAIAGVKAAWEAWNQYPSQKAGVVGAKHSRDNLSVFPKDLSPNASPAQEPGDKSNDY